MIKYIEKDGFYYQVALLPDIKDIDFGKGATYISEEKHNDFINIKINKEDNVKDLKMQRRTEKRIYKTEKDIVEYGKSIGADVDVKYSKKKNIENIDKV